MKTFLLENKFFQNSNFNKFVQSRKGEQWHVIQCLAVLESGLAER